MEQEKAYPTSYELFTSDVTILELDSAREDIRENLLEVIQKYRIKIVSITDAARRLAQEYVARGMIPAKYRADAEHIAVASLEGFDALASWNLRHIVKLKTKSMVRLINRETGYSIPEIIRPDEVL
jgi:predicted nucleic acid-binding protein